MQSWEEEHICSMASPSANSMTDEERSMMMKKKSMHASKGKVTAFAETSTASVLSWFDTMTKTKSSSVVTGDNKKDPAIGKWTGLSLANALRGSKKIKMN